MSFISNYLKGMDLSFKDFMELALYHPSHGYYCKAQNRVSRDGDYVTSPVLSPAFAFALGRLVSEFVERAGDGMAAFVDIGSGDGTLLAELARQSRPYEGKVALFGVDRSLDRLRPDIRDIRFVTTLDQLPRGMPTLVFSNELFDAFPVARLVRRGDDLHELWVSEGDEELGWVERDADEVYAVYLAERDIELADGQFVDISLEWQEEYRRLCEISDRSLIVTIDYGFETKRLFDQRIRHYGTVAAFRNHQVSRDLLATPGDQDLTAHINFSDLIRAGETAGMKTLSLTRQNQFLLSLGITDHESFRTGEDLRTEDAGEALALVDERESARRLVMPDGLGEEMKVLVQSKNLPETGWSFQRKLF